MSLIGIIGGSGLYQMKDVTIREEKWIDTPFGKPSDAVMLGTLAGKEVAFLPRHGRGHRILPHEINFRANIYALKSLGVSQIISVSAVGSMKEAIHPGHLVLVDQFIDRTKNRVDTFFGNGIAAHVSFADPICERIRKQLVQATKSHGITAHDGGTYVCIEGPMFSSRAESRVYRSWDVDVIGMTNYQEAKLAREAEICYATIALSTDYDCWHEEEGPVDVAMVVKTMQENVEKAQKTITTAIAHLTDEPSCPCHGALKFAVMTDPKVIPQETKEKLNLIMGKYFKQGVL
ncbi:MAG: S-methyl-5'-thioadenosine phosphorylase [Deltaproteobacteria bacterium]|nr:S-methyl-5'-thioadenosine phosphorylase [Deltaproteobacteria bacterium]